MFFHSLCYFQLTSFSKEAKKRVSKESAHFRCGTSPPLTMS